MNLENAIVFAHQRMLEIGKKREEYHLEPFSIVGTAQDRERGELFIYGYNEYYFLLEYQNYYGLQIVSDTGYFNADDLSQNTTQEFTGDIRIQKLTGKAWSISPDLVQTHPVDFLRITIY